MSNCSWLNEALSPPMRRSGVFSYKFGQTFAGRLRRRRPRPGDEWYFDEVFVRIQGVQHYLWRAVDREGVVLDILVQPRRDAKAAKQFFRRLLKGLQYVPRVIVTDKLRSYGVAQRELLSKGRTSTKQISQQSRGELSSSDTPPRAPDATIQIA